MGRAVATPWRIENLQVLDDDRTITRLEVHGGTGGDDCVDAWKPRLPRLRQLHLENCPRELVLDLRDTPKLHTLRVSNSPRLRSLRVEVQMQLNELRVGACEQLREFKLKVKFDHGDYDEALDLDLENCLALKRVDAKVDGVGRKVRVRLPPGLRLDFMGITTNMMDAAHLPVQPVSAETLSVNGMHCANACVNWAHFADLVRTVRTLVLQHVGSVDLGWDAVELTAPQSESVRVVHLVAGDQVGYNRLDLTPCPNVHTLLIDPGVEIHHFQAAAALALCDRVPDLDAWRDPATGVVVWKDDLHVEDVEDLHLL